MEKWQLNGPGFLFNDENMLELSVVMVTHACEFT